MSSEFDLRALLDVLDAEVAERIVRKGRAQAINGAKRGASLVGERIADDDEELEATMWAHARPRNRFE